MYKNPWAAPILVSLMLLGFLLFVDREESFDENDGPAPWLRRGPVESAREAVQMSAWRPGSSEVLASLAACLESAELYLPDPEIGPRPGQASDSPGVFG